MQWVDSSLSAVVQLVAEHPQYRTSLREGKGQLIPTAEYLTILLQNAKYLDQARGSEVVLKRWCYAIALISGPRLTLN